MRLLVAGATGGTGSALLTQAIEAGHDVTVIARHPSRLPADELPDVTVIEGSMYGGNGIRVNCISRSAIETERKRIGVSETDRKQLGAAFPPGRIGEPDDVTAATHLLASSASSWITEITIDIAGRKVMP